MDTKILTANNRIVAIRRRLLYFCHGAAKPNILQHSSVQSKIASCYLAWRTRRALNPCCPPHRRSVSPILKTAAGCL